jgi:formate dehydrogenase major subunit/formate dehydrogenase alpha subunit
MKKSAFSKKTLTTCPYCGTGCNFYLLSEGEELVGCDPSTTHSVSQGQLCIKGFNAFQFVNHPDRLKTPLIRKNGKLEAVSWDEALKFTARRLKEIQQQYSSDALMFLSSAKTTNEENYLLMKLARAAFQTNNVDHCARLCHASTVAGLGAVFGSGAMTNSIDCVLKSDCIFVIGSNTTEQHPMIGTRIIRAVTEKNAQLIVADNRTIRLAALANLHIKHKNGTDVALLNGIMHVILKENLENKTFIAARTENFESFKKTIENYPPERVATICEIPAENIIQAARLFSSAKNAMIIYSMGITQHTTGVDNVKSCANLAMLTGHIGRPGTGVNPLRGQNNFQGACDMGALPNVYSGYQKVTDEEARKKFASAWHVKSLPAENGLTVTAAMDAAVSGKIKGMFIMGENPMMSDPDQTHIEHALKNLEFLAVQDIFMTPTALLADVVLPAASFAEKDGTFTSTERRVQRVRRAIDPVGSSRADWEILGDLAKQSGYTHMKYASPAHIMEEIAMLTPSYGGIRFSRLEKGGLVWPCPSLDHPGTPILHTEKFTRGLGLFSGIDD